MAGAAPGRDRLPPDWQLTSMAPPGSLGSRAYSQDKSCSRLWGSPPQLRVPPKTSPRHGGGFSVGQAGPVWAGICDQGHSSVQRQSLACEAGCERKKRGEMKERQRSDSPENVQMLRFQGTDLGTCGKAAAGQHCSEQWAPPLGLQQAQGQR